MAGFRSKLSAFEKKLIKKSFSHFHFPPHTGLSFTVSVTCSQARENVGMAAVFTVVSAVQDELNRHSEECLNRIKVMEEERNERKKNPIGKISQFEFLSHTDG